MEPDIPPSSYEPIRDRDAYATIRGFFYQAERTVQRWIGLKTGETLVLEYGEDIDIVSRSFIDGEWKEERVLEQLKSWEKKITLIAGREALANFQEHRETHPGENLRFCLTTNAEIGVERSPLFKDRKPGIEWWRTLASGELDEIQTAGVLQRIRDKLEVSGLPENFNPDTWEKFQSFVSIGDEDDWLDFIQRFEWQTGTTGPLQLSDEIQNELLEFGIASDDAIAQAQYERLLVFVLRLLYQEGLKILRAKDWKSVARSELTGLDRKLLDGLYSRQARLEQRYQELEQRVEAHYAELGVFKTEVSATLTNHEPRLAQIEENQTQFVTTLVAGQEMTQEQLGVIVGDMEEFKRTKSEDEIKNSPQFQAWQMEVRIEESRKLLKAGKFGLANIRFTELKAQVSELEVGEARAKLESRIDGALGICVWRAGDSEAANALFQRSYLLDRTNVKRIANAAFGKLLVNEPGGAYWSCGRNSCDIGGRSLSHLQGL